MNKHFIVIAYDIPNDRRRVKLHNLLKDYGTPVQYSLFECAVSKEKEEEMKKRIMKLIKKKVGRVRIYPLCESCVKKIEAPGEKDVVGNQPDMFIE
mgnify:CR=1 FL=1